MEPEGLRSLQEVRSIAMVCKQRSASAEERVLYPEDLQLEQGLCILPGEVPRKNSTLVSKMGLSFGSRAGKEA